MSDDGISRRSLLRGAALTAGAGVIGFIVADNTSAARSNGGAGPNPYGTNSKDTSELLAHLDQLPVNGGVILTSARIVVTRETGDIVHAFSAVCTHQGCIVGTVANGTIDCPCHGSRFNANTGAVVNGPATSPLPSIPIELRSGDVYRT
jgi:Rieske Fe-S protein